MSNVEEKCFHCGILLGKDTIVYDEKKFCCSGCKTVYEIFRANDLSCYYDLASNPGASPIINQQKFDFLNHTETVEKLLDFSDNQLHIISLYIPHIHCSSCIWILENLQKINKNISHTQVNFPKKTVRVHYNPQLITLKEIVVLLASIGYEPYISLDDVTTKKKKVNRSLIYKLGVAGFAFGNVMLLSFPEYFEVDEFWLNQYKPFFRWLMLLLSLPVVFYASSEYFSSAIKSIKSKLLNIDIPIALGIFTLFIRSVFEVITNIGSGFFDSLTGLVFFLLLGKFFQQKTYNFLSFERDYKSYFPIGITKIDAYGKEENIPVYDIKKGDRLLIRNEELIPTDAILINGNAQIDYSFVTGEATPIYKNSGDKLFAGGKQLGSAIEIDVLKEVSQSYLTQLWSNDAFTSTNKQPFKSITDSISKHFTITVLLIAVIATCIWFFIDSSKALQVFTAVLIVACPCALALAAPFTLGNVLRIFGKQHFYIKDSNVVEKIAKINSIIFDKTGTITTGNTSKIAYEGENLTTEEQAILKSTLRNSNHPLSRQLYDLLNQHDIVTLDHFEETKGKGIAAISNQQKIKLGAANFVGAPSTTSLATNVYVSCNEHYKGKFTFNNSYRKGVSKVFKTLHKHYHLAILSGDNESEKEHLKKLLPASTKLFFNQQPAEKLDYIKMQQLQGENVMMIGDGLNDAGALKQSNIGISIAENVNVFSPACDAILAANQFSKIPHFIKVSKQAVRIIKWSFFLSFLYNSVGLYFAVTGLLSPVVAAILMPLSSISVVAFTTLATNLICKKLK
ncbi:heavy metal translocating P-type ATPase [Zhouia sp. PK063]|uniref:heavy metal translocating P-type ATPase n=1 Tax=Zhouia sp. PK063 TaxID=3373602 RepID=UPI0037A253E9